MKTIKAVLLGTLAVGVFDGLDAVIFFGLRGIAPARIFQSISSGLLGKSAFQGGNATVALGVALHFVVSFGIVCAYLIASRFFPLLIRRPILCGLAYGVGVYLFMNLVVLPLSAATVHMPTIPVLLDELFVHAVFVGPSAAFAARAARR